MLVREHSVGVRLLFKNCEHAKRSESTIAVRTRGGESKEAGDRMGTETHKR